ncbi:unnamed protein product, partial [Onchocerca ochengi]|uniref:DH domain-containing protein n=1 Tax=Onchocerca ochengi TaxID=42157 RepID=A0A182EY04_ONCOC
TVLYRHCNLRHRNDIRFEIYFYIIHPKKDDAITSRLIRTLPELKKQCEGVTEVIKVLSDALNERQNAADIRRTEMDEHLPFTSILVRKLRAEIEDNKNLAQEAS